MVRKFRLPLADHRAGAARFHSAMYEADGLRVFDTHIPRAARQFDHESIATKLRRCLGRLRHGALGRCREGADRGPLVARNIAGGWPHRDDATSHDSNSTGPASVDIPAAAKVTDLHRSTWACDCWSPRGEEVPRVSLVGPDPQTLAGAISH
jgi:hypothetical protein